MVLTSSFQCCLEHLLSGSRFVCISLVVNKATPKPFLPLEQVQDLETGLFGGVSLVLSTSKQMLGLNLFGPFHFKCGAEARI